MNHASKNLIVIDHKPDEKTKELVNKIVKASNSITVFAENLTPSGVRLMDWIKVNFPEITRLSLPAGYKSWFELHLAKIKGLNKPNAKVVGEIEIK